MLHLISCIERATLVLREMEKKNIPIDTIILNSFLAVYTEAVKVDRVNEALELFEKYNVSLDRFSYKHIIRMYVRARDISKAMKYKEMAESSGIVLEGAAYGILMQSLTQRNMVVDALKILEYAADHKILIPERFLRLLRVRCRKLKVNHPDMPADPSEWVKHVSAMRKKLKYSSNSRTERLRTAISFTK